MGIPQCPRLGSLSPAPSQPPSEKSVTHVWSRHPQPSCEEGGAQLGQEGGVPRPKNTARRFSGLHTGCLPCPASGEGLGAAALTGSLRNGTTAGRLSLGGGS